MVSKEKLQEQIAKVRGWKRLDDKGHPGILWGENPEGFWVEVPNWPSNRDESYKLLHKMNAEDTRSATIAAQKYYRFMLATHPANEESLIYLWHEGWRWVECECLVSNDDPPTDCPMCSGKGGEFLDSRV